MATEDFTFPVVSGDTCPSSIDSPPLWRLSPAASPEPRHRTRGGNNEEEEEEEDFFSLTKSKIYKQRKSCSDIENNKKANSGIRNRNYKSEDDDDGDGDDGDEKEEKMDVLWEDFNEELSTGKNSRMLIEAYNNNKSSSSSSSGDMVGLGCVQALKLSRTNNNGAIFSPSSSSPPSKKNNKNHQPGMVVFIKVLKRLFLLHNSQHHHHHHHHQHQHHRHKSMKTGRTW